MQCVQAATKNGWQFGGDLLGRAPQQQLTAGMCFAAAAIKAVHADALHSCQHVSSLVLRFQACASGTTQGGLGDSELPLAVPSGSGTFS